MHEVLFSVFISNQQYLSYYADEIQQLSTKFKVRFKHCSQTQKITDNCNSCLIEIYIINLDKTKISSFSIL